MSNIDTLYVKKNSKKLYIKHKGIYITYTSYKKKHIKKKVHNIL